MVPSAAWWTSRNTPRSTRVSIGISGSVTVAATTRAFASDSNTVIMCVSPLPSGVGAGDRLHFCQYVTQRFSVGAVPAGSPGDQGRRPHRWQVCLPGPDNPFHHTVEIAAQPGRIDRDTCGG